MTLDDERLAQLARTKLEGLVRRAVPDATAPASTFPAGAGMRVGPAAYVYLTKPTPSPLGAVLAWGEAQGATDLHVIVDAVDTTMLQMARGLAPSPSIWRAVGTEMVAAESPAAPPPPPIPDAVVSLIPVLERGGCDVVVEHGVVVGEILGLEVARIVVDAAGEASVRVGVGLYDQEAHELVHARESVDARLTQVVAEVRRHRRAGVGSHPINRAARERWLRAALIEEPERIGLRSLEAVEPLKPRGGIYEGGPVAALGAADGGSTLVVTAVGIDLDAVPVAAGHLALTAADRVMLAMPGRDLHPIIERQAGRLAAPVELLPVDPPWV